MKIAGVVAGILLVATAAQAKVTYDFDGDVREGSLIGAGGKFTGSVELDEEAAAPDVEAREATFNASGQRISFFIIPCVITVSIGTEVFVGQPSLVTFQAGGFDFVDLPMGNGRYATNSGFYLSGDLFDQDPDQTLAGARWDNLKAPEADWDLDTYGDGGALGRISLKFAKASRRHDQLASANLGGDTNPTPEPWSATLLGTALGVGGIWRNRRALWKSVTRKRFVS